MSEENPSRHFYLYAKNHYLRTDLKTDLLKILENYTGTPVEYLKVGDLVAVLLPIAYKHINNEHQFTNFIYKNLSKTESIIGKIETEPVEHYLIILETCLSTLVTVKVDDIDFKLGEIDENILPKSRG